MIDILVRASLIHTGSEAIRDGYIYIKGGRIVEVGSGPAPEDYTYAALILGGPGRVVVPGLAAVIDAPAYPIRLLKPSLKDRLNYYKAMGLEALAAVSLPAVYEAHMAGVTSVIVETLDPGLPQRLSDTVGGIYGAAYPACTEAGDAPGLAATTTVSDPSCPGGAVDYGDKEVLALDSRLAYNLAGEDSVYERSVETRRRLGLQEQGLREGRVAEVAVFNSSRPPAMLLDYSRGEEVLMVYGVAQVESLLAGDHVLVDGGEHLYIVEKSFSQARSVASRILSPKV
ncbi:MAG: hypothetical protein F7B18_03720 [Desulfurococcales archaeon]|nr:hypothetical protein [Desulfurococcales archaeon]